MRIAIAQSGTPPVTSVRRFSERYGRSSVQRSITGRWPKESSGSIFQGRLYRHGQILEDTHSPVLRSQVTRYERPNQSIHGSTVTATNTSRTRAARGGASRERVSRLRRQIRCIDQLFRRLEPPPNSRPETRSQWSVPSI